MLDVEFWDRKISLISEGSSWWFKVTFLGCLSDPFKGLSDLQLGDEKGTLNHLADVFFFFLSKFLNL